MLSGVREQLEGIYEALDLQMKRTAQLQVQLDGLCGRMQLLTGSSH
jgi:hypothetical protein